MSPTDQKQAVAGARASLIRLVARGSRLYDRSRHLHRLLGPECASGDELAEQRQRLARLVRALRLERQRGRAGHWSYDLNRHIALAEAYAAEKRRLRRTAPAARR